MDKLEFEYPTDFADEVEEAPPRAELPPFKASAILYVTSALHLFGGILIPLLEMMSRVGPRPDTIIEMFAWNPFSEIGLIMLAYGLFLFLLGLMSDRRGA